MKNRKLIFVVALIMSFVMMFGTFSAAAAEETTVPSTQGTYEEGYEDGYNEGFTDGYVNGYDDGYNNGANSGSNQNRFPSIFEFIEELRWKLEIFIEDIKYRLIDALMIDFPSPEFDNSYLPAENQKVLGDEALALCEEFNAMMLAAYEVKEETIVNKTAQVDFDVIDVLGGKLTTKLINPILEEYLVDTTSTETYFEGDHMWNLQDITLYPEGLVSAEKTVNADGTTNYEFVLKEEAAYYSVAESYGNTIGVINEGGKPAFLPFGIYHDSCADTLDLYWFTNDFAPLQITGASINYPGATIKATTDAQGRFTSLSIDMPVKGGGEFAFGLIKGNISMEGYRNEGFTFEYAA